MLNVSLLEAVINELNNHQKSDVGKELQWLLENNISQETTKVLQSASYKDAIVVEALDWYASCFVDDRDFEVNSNIAKHLQEYNYVYYSIYERLGHLIPFACLTKLSSLDSELGGMAKHVLTFAHKSFDANLMEANRAVLISKYGEDSPESRLFDRLANDNVPLGKVIELCDDLEWSSQVMLAQIQVYKSYMMCFN